MQKVAVDKCWYIITILDLLFLFMAFWSAHGTLSIRRYVNVIPLTRTHFWHWHTHTHTPSYNEYVDFCMHVFVYVLNKTYNVHQMIWLFIKTFVVWCCIGQYANYFFYFFSQKVWNKPMCGASEYSRYNNLFFPDTNTVA